MERSLEELLEDALRAARAGDWAAYRMHLDELCSACAGLAEQHEDLRQHFETLALAAPEHDPEGCRAEIEALAALLRAQHAGALRALRRSPAQRALDLRGLQPPEPIVRIFEALERAPGEPLRAILPHEPVPLYGLLRERGFRYAGSTRPDGGFELLIERA